MRIVAVLGLRDGGYQALGIGELQGVHGIRSVHGDEAAEAGVAGQVGVQGLTLAHLHVRVVFERDRSQAGVVVEDASGR